MRWALFLVIMAFASLYDYHHEVKGTLPVPVESGPDQQADQSMLYFCNPVASISLKAPVQKVQLKRLEQNNTENLMFLHSARIFHLLKAEIPQLPENTLNRHFTAFRQYHFSDPDDLPDWLG